jgi:RecA/RadA recombinase
MDKLIRTLDFQNEADLLLATKEDLQKCKIKDKDITEHTITSVYAQAAILRQVEPKNCFEELYNEINKLRHFMTGVDELDKCLGEQGICSDELVEVCGASGSGKTYFCLKFASLALLEQNVAVIYIDTTNYINLENITQELKVSNSLECLSPCLELNIVDC